MYDSRIHPTPHSIHYSLHLTLPPRPRLSDKTPRHIRHRPLILSHVPLCWLRIPPLCSRAAHWAAPPRAPLCQVLIEAFVIRKSMVFVYRVQCYLPYIASYPVPHLRSSATLMLLPTRMNISYDPLCWVRIAAGAVWTVVFGGWLV